MKIYSSAILIFLLVISAFSLFGLEDSDTAIDFIELSDGILVDARIKEEVVEVIFRHFQAIEDGDLSAFRDTLVAQDMVDVYHQIGLMIRYFGDLFEDSEKLAENIHSLNQGVVDSAFYDLFYKEYPLRNRNTGMRIQVIRLSESDIGITIELTNNKNEHIIYWILAGPNGVGQHINPQHFQR